MRPLIAALAVVVYMLASMALIPHPSPQRPPAVVVIAEQGYEQA